MHISKQELLKNQESKIIHVSRIHETKNRIQIRILLIEVI